VLAETEESGDEVVLPSETMRLATTPVGRGDPALKAYGQWKEGSRLLGHWALVSSAKSVFGKAEQGPLPMLADWDNATSAKAFRSCGSSSPAVFR